MRICARSERGKDPVVSIIVAFVFDCRAGLENDSVDLDGRCEKRIVERRWSDIFGQR